MSKLKIVKLSEIGLHDAEVMALERISEILPNYWLAYSNFEFRNKKSGNREIDLVLVTSNLIILVELKNWNGQLKSEGNNWILNGQNRGESPVAITNRKCQLLKSIIREREKHNIGTFYVQPIVVLCGNADSRNLSEQDKGFVASIENFCKIGDEKYYKRQFPSARERRDPLYKKKEIFNRIFSVKLFDPRKFRYSGYIPKGSAIFSHQNDLYQEFISTDEKNPRHRALLRTWDLNQLPANSSTQSKWKEVTQREKDTIGYIKEVLPRQFVSDTILMSLATTPEEEFSSKYFELFELPQQSEMLSTYISRTSGKISLTQRLQMIGTLLSVFAQLHEVNVAHRDISDSSIWTGDDLAVLLSRWLAASYPEGKTVGAIREFLHSGRSVTPEDKYGEPSDPFRRDVFLLGALVYFILSSKHLTLDEGVAVWEKIPESICQNEQQRKRINECLEKALSWDLRVRYSNASEFFNAFQVIVDIHIVKRPIFIDELEGFITNTIPYSKYPIEKEISHSDIHIYESNAHDSKIIVKVWTGLKISESNTGNNFRLLTFLGFARDLNRIKPHYAHTVIDFGISTVGVYLVVEKITGETLDIFSSAQLGMQEKLQLALKCLEIVNALHSMGIWHGDIKPQNFIVSGDNTILIEDRNIHIIDCPDLDIDTSQRKTPAYYDEASEGWDNYIKDRFALILTIGELLTASFECIAGRRKASFSFALLDDLEDEINRHLEMIDGPKTMEIIEARLIDALKKVTEPAIQRIEIPLRGIKVRTPVLPDGDEYSIYVSKAPESILLKQGLVPSQNRYFEISFSGVISVLRIIWDKFDAKVVTGQLVEKKHSYFEKNKEINLLKAFFVLLPAEYSDFSKLSSCLKGTIEDVISIFVNDALGGSNNTSKEDVFNLKPAEIEVPAHAIEKLWRALIDAESDVLPEITVTDDSEELNKNQNQIIVSYELSNGQPIEFDTNEVVLVEKKSWDGKFRSIGELILKHFTANTLGILLTKGSSPKSGDLLRINSALGKASYEKRNAAIERLIGRKSVYPTIIDWMSGQKPAPITVENIDLISLAEICSKFRLNTSQRAAFNKVFTYTPFGLVQGPPGTGKTYFIAVLIYLLLKEDVHNILLTSQSHEAVNNCVEKLIAINKDNLESLDLVRVGPISMCSQGAANYHINNIQQRYRKQFEVDIRNRIEKCAINLGLPQQFVSQFVRLSLALIPLIEHYESKRKELEETDDIQGKEKIKRSMNSIILNIIGKAKRISSRLSIDIDIESKDPRKELDRMKRSIANHHDITNEDAVSRLEHLINIAFEWNSALQSPHGNFGEFLARTKRVVCGTCVGIGRRELNITNQSYEWVVIDEAARCTAGELAVPSQTAQRLVLVGDHHQLPPMYTKEVLEVAREKLQLRKSEELLRSDFARAIDSSYGKQVSQLLNEQYRMKFAIGQVVSDLFYGRQLQTVRTMSDDILISNSLPRPFISDVTWCDTSPLGMAAQDQREIDQTGQSGKSYLNNGEIRVILDLLRLLADVDIFSEKKSAMKIGSFPIGVICAYAAQKQELMSQFRQRPFSEDFRNLVKIDTVDSYQGKENLIIIFSLVRNNQDYDPGYLYRKERVNVAISRAMERLVIVGSSQMWSKTETPPGLIFNYIKDKAITDDRYSIIDSSDLVKQL